MAGNYRSGRKPKTDALRVLEGGKAKGVLPEPSIPPKPDHISADPLAEKYWDDYAARLARNGVLQEDYGQLLALVSHLSAAYERALKQFAEANYKAFMAQREGSKVTVVELPFNRRLESMGLSIVKMLGEFGLTPVMAAKLAKPKQEGPSRWERLTQRRG